jgi:hypothetical protein
MVFNIASAALVVQDRNNGVSCASYTLSFIQLVLLCITMVSLFGRGLKSAIVMLCVCVINIAYSGMIIDYYQNGKPIDDDLYNFAIVVLVFNSLSIVSQALYGGYVGYYGKGVNFKIHPM